MKITIQKTFIDRAIETISPKWALERHKSRVAMALSGGYSGASYREAFQYWQPGVADSDGDTVRDLRELRARSRDLVRNSPIAGGAIETSVTHVIGCGLSVQPRIDADYLGMTEDEAEAWQEDTEREFCMWADEFADWEGQLSFYELQQLAFRSMMESGDTFGLLVGHQRNDSPYQLAVQLIEADRVCNPNFKADTEKMVQGVEKDDRGAPVAIHVADRHPGTTFYQAKGINWTRITFRGENSGRKNVLHLMRKLRPGQTRGIPELAPIIDSLKQLTRYATAEVDAAVNSAALALFVKMDPETFQDIFDDSAQKSIIDSAKRWDGSLKSGAAVNLLPGEEIQSATMNRPNPNFEPFIDGFMTQIGMALNIPKEVLTKHFQSSYSAARAALLDAWRVFKIRRVWMACKFCQPIYSEWLAEAVSIGRVKAPGFFADPAIRAAWCKASWTGDGPGAIDPLKEVNAAKERVNMGLTTLAEEIIAYDGGDWKEKHQESVRITEDRIEDGLQAPITVPMQGNGTTIQPAEEPGDTGNNDTD